MITIDDLRKVAKRLDTPGSSLPHDEERLDMIRQDISLVTIQKNLIEGGVGKTLAVRPKQSHEIAISWLLLNLYYQKLESLTVAEAYLRARVALPLEADERTATCELYDWISSFILPGDEFVSESEHFRGMNTVYFLETCLS